MMLIAQSLVKHFSRIFDETFEIAWIIVGVLEKVRVSYDYIQTLAWQINPQNYKSLAYDALLSMSYWNILSSEESMGCMAWEDNLIKTSLNKIYKVPASVAYTYEYFKQTGEWNWRHGVKAYFKSIGEPKVREAVQATQKIIENPIHGRYTTAIQIRNYAKECNYPYAGKLIAELKGGGIISPSIKTFLYAIQGGRETSSPLYQINRSLMVK